MQMQNRLGVKKKTYNFITVYETFDIMFYTRIQIKKNNKIKLYIYTNNYKAQCT